MSTEYEGVGGPQELGGTNLADSSRAPGQCLQSHRILIIQAISGK